MTDIASTIKIAIQTTGDLEAQNAIQGVGKAADLTKGLISGLKGALVGLSAEALVSATKEALEFGDSLAETSAKLGVTAETLQRVQSLAIGMNTDVNSLTEAFKSSKEAIGLYELGASKAQKAMGLLGTEVTDAIKAGKSSEEIFLLQVKALSEYSDTSERAAVANKAGLGAMLDMATAYADGKMSIDDLKKAMAEANVISDEQVAKAGEINDKWDKAIETLNILSKKTLLGFIDNLTDTNAKIDESSNFLVRWIDLMAKGMLTSAQFVGLASKSTEERANEIALEIDKKQKALARAGGGRGMARLSPEEKDQLQKEIDGLMKDLGKIQDNAAILKAKATSPERPDQPTPSRPKGASDLSKEDTSTDKAAKAAERAKREEERYAEHSLQVLNRLRDEKIKVIADTTTSQIQQLDLLKQAELNAADETINSAKLKGEEEVEARKRVVELKAAIEDKYAQKRVDIEKNAQEQIKGFTLDSESYVAQTENDKIAIIKASVKVQLSAQEDYYRKTKEAALAAGQDISGIEIANATKVQAIKKSEGEAITRVSGGYWEKLTQKFTDMNREQGSISEQFNNKLVDMTLSSTDMIAQGFVDMAESGKASWADMAQNIVKQIEYMSVKMLAMYAIQQLVGMVSGGVTGGGTDGGIVTAGLNSGSASWGTGMFSHANGTIMPYATGGVPDVSDQAFKFRQPGGIGIGREAGPEALMPIVRDSSNKLAVKAIGTSGEQGISIGAIHVTIKEQKDETSEQQSMRIGKSIRSELEQMIDKRIGNSVRSGNTLNPTSTRNAFS